MPDYTPAAILALAGPELSAAVEWLCFGDDLHVGGNKRRLSEAVSEICVPLDMKASLQPTGTLDLSGGGPDIYLEVYAWSQKNIGNSQSIGVFPFPLTAIFSKEPNRRISLGRWAWENREGQPWQAALEQHVAQWQAPPRPFATDVGLAVTTLMPWIRKRIGSCSLDSFNNKFGVRAVYHEGGFIEAFGPDAATAVCRAACLAALEERRP